MEILQMFSVSHNPEFFRLCLFLMLVILIWQLEKLNKLTENLYKWIELLIQKIDTLPVNKQPNDKPFDSYRSGFRQGYAEAVDDLRSDSTRKSDDESPKVS